MTRTCCSLRLPHFPLIFDLVYSMKLAKSLTLIISPSILIPFALADFHIIQGIAPGGGSGVVACPSNYYKLNCNCLENGDRAAQVSVGDSKGVGSLPETFFSVKSGLCGFGQLNFYKQRNGVWNIYENNGNGHLQGACYSNTAGTSCSSGYFKFFYDQLICYSYICRH